MKDGDTSRNARVPDAVHHNRGNPCHNAEGKPLICITPINCFFGTVKRPSALDNIELAAVRIFSAFLAENLHFVLLKVYWRTVLADNCNGCVLLDLGHYSWPKCGKNIANTRNLANSCPFVRKKA